MRLCSAQAATLATMEPRGRRGGGGEHRKLNQAEVVYNGRRKGVAGRKGDRGVRTSRNTSRNTRQESILMSSAQAATLATVEPCKSGRRTGKEERRNGAEVLFFTWLRV